MPWHFGIIGLAAAAAGLGVAVSEGGLAIAVLWPVGSTLALTLGAVQLMKLANRNAQRRIAAGEFPDIAAVGSGDAAPEVETLPTAV